MSKSAITAPALARIALREAEADAARAAGDQGSLVGQLHSKFQFASFESDVGEEQYLAARNARTRLCSRNSGRKNR